MVLNVGNTRLSVGVFVGGELQYSTRIPHAQRGEWQARLKEAWERIADADQSAVAAAGVNPPLIEPLEHAVKQATGATVEWVGTEVELPIKVLTEQPKETGVDRVLKDRKSVV